MPIDKSSQQLITRARSAPRLSPEHERQHILAWQLRGDRRAAAAVIEANLRHVVFAALRFKNYGVPIADLIGEGCLGLMKALDRFDESHGARFGTYAMFWVRAQIVEAVLESWSLLSGPRGALDSRVFFRLRRERARLAAREPLGAGGAGEEELLAAQFNVSERRMQEMLSQLDARGVSLDAPGPAREPRLLDELAAEPDQSRALERRQERAELERILERVRAELDPRERFILERRLLAEPDERLSLGQIGERFGVSRERVRQLEVRAQRKLRAQAVPDGRGAAPRAA